MFCGVVVHTCVCVCVRWVGECRCSCPGVVACQCLVRFCIQKDSAWMPCGGAVSRKLKH